MVLHPLDEPNSSAITSLPAWKVVEQSQKQSSRCWYLTTQPDHAALAGDLAARLNFPAIPAMSPEIIRAIALHDEGWARIDAEDLALYLTKDRGSATKPRSFLEIEPAEFLVAWIGSIEAGESCGPLGGLVISGHFQRLARARLESRQNSAADTQRLQEFLNGELCREKCLRKETPATNEEISLLTDILQFCDLVSLYLCSGSRAAVTFPQQFDGKNINVRPDGDLYRFSPAVFCPGGSLGVSARRYPGGQLAALPFLVE